MAFFAEGSTSRVPSSPVKPSQVRSQGRKRWILALARGSITRLRIWQNSIPFIYTVPDRPLYALLKIHMNSSCTAYE